MRFASIATLAATAQAGFLSDRLTAEDHEFIRFVAKYGKTYGTRAEFEFRAAQFKENLAGIMAHNESNDETHTVAINEFADYTPEQWSRMRGYKAVQTNAEPVSFFTGKNDESVNWVTKGAVNPVKNQASCGSCWAFSTTGAVEGADFIATGKLNSYSEQQLVDCDRDDGNMGCNGGDMATAMEYIEKNPLMLEADYPYKGRD